MTQIARERMWFNIIKKYSLKENLKQPILFAMAWLLVQLF